MDVSLPNTGMPDASIISHKLSDYDFDLPKELIAQKPTEERDNARLLVLHRRTGRMEHRRFSEIAGYLRPEDLLVLNNTKVIPSRIAGKKPHGAYVDLLFIEELEGNHWKALLKSNGPLKKGEKIYLDNTAVSASLLGKHEDNSWILRIENGANIRELIHRTGEMPLPPYIKRPKKNNTLSTLDAERYQTVFAQKEGAIAAPTAGLHFSKDVLGKIRNSGTDIAFVTLHVGLGTFLPIKTEEIKNHHMHKEYYEYPRELLKKITITKNRGGRIIATGSTSCRTLETIALNNNIHQFSGYTDLFIYPPYPFQYVDALITNFHLPKTTLFLLVSAFAGREQILNAYEIAKKEGYRFYSYGDCMLII
ncbi:tRNA preQ1(34) S-adenosylmethionine ribosyltransferase-isomerase QueA [Candidatus Kuenenia sp.]|uniref:tRNA preQ1(34) S-adenosylmethionine ribosyltransferase-isomerase QueA n=1 Tax=Candidatus Kuenenia sp. TaxID=2499824 RepID=UPI00321FC911